MGALDAAGQLVVSHIRDPLHGGIDVHPNHKMTRIVGDFCGDLATGSQCPHGLEVKTRHQPVIDEVCKRGSVDTDDSRCEGDGKLLVEIRLRASDSGHCQSISYLDEHFEDPAIAARWHRNG